MCPVTCYLMHHHLKVVLVSMELDGVTRSIDSPLIAKTVKLDFVQNGELFLFSVILPV